MAVDDPGVTVALENQRLIDELWDFADPTASEARFVEAAADAQTDEQPQSS